MPNTFNLIASSTVGAGGAANIDFTSIPATYTDLCLKLSLRSDTTGTSRSLDLTFNNNTGTNYSTRYAYGYASGTASGSTSAATSMYVGLYGGSAYTADTFCNFELYIPNYAGSTNKSVSADSAAENNSTTNYLGFWSGLWEQTTAISSIKLLGATNFVKYSTAYLYGISKS